MFLLAHLQNPSPTHALHQCAAKACTSRDKLLPNKWFRFGNLQDERWGGVMVATVGMESRSPAHPRGLVPVTSYHRAPQHVSQSAPRDA